MDNTVYMVYSVWVAGGLRVFAICGSSSAAQRARKRVAKGTVKVGKRTRYFDAALPNVYACQLHILPVQVNVSYAQGLEDYFSKKEAQD